MGPQFNQPMSNAIMTVPVQGESGANMYPVAMGNTVLLIDFNAGKFWLKSNEGGIPSPLRTFNFKEEIPKIQNDSNSVSREEFNTLAQSVSTMSDNLSKLITELGGSANE